MAKKKGGPGGYHDDDGGGEEQEYHITLLGRRSNGHSSFSPSVFPVLVCFFSSSVWNINCSVFCSKEKRNIIRAVYFLFSVVVFFTYLDFKRLETIMTWGQQAHWGYPKADQLLLSQMCSMALPVWDN